MPSLLLLCGQNFRVGQQQRAYALGVVLDDGLAEIVRQTAIAAGRAAETVAAEKAHSIQVAVLGTYVELAINDESRLKNAADFKSQLAVCKALGAGCIGTETTSMEKQPAGTTREEAQELLCRSLADILPAAEALGVTVAVEPVTYHSMNSAAATRHILDTMRSPNLKVIFDMSNLVDAGNVGAQDRIWNDVGELLGDQIVAVHFKGQAFAPDGGLLHTSLEDSLTDYAGAFAMLRQLPQDALPVLREEAVPARAGSDIAFMRGFFA